MIERIKNSKFKIKDGMTPEVIKPFNLTVTITSVFTKSEPILNFSSLIFNY